MCLFNNIRYLLLLLTVQRNAIYDQLQGYVQKFIVYVYKDGPKSNENYFFCAAQKGQERIVAVVVDGGGTQVYSLTLLS